MAACAALGRLGASTVRTTTTKKVASFDRSRSRSSCRRSRRGATRPRILSFRCTEGQRGPGARSADCGQPMAGIISRGDPKHMRLRCPRPPRSLGATFLSDASSFKINGKRKSGSCVAHGRGLKGVCLLRDSSKGWSAATDCPSQRSIERRLKYASQWCGWAVWSGGLPHDCARQARAQRGAQA